MSLALAFATSYLSGHGFDELSVSMFVALIATCLLKNLGVKDGQA